MQTAVNMTIPFGVSVADKFGPPEYSVDLSFRGQEQRADIKEFMDVMTKIDERMLEEGVKNCKSWFKSDLNKEVIKAFYTPTVKYSKDKEGNVLSYPPNLKLKLRRINNEFETKFYDVNGTPYKGVPVEDMLVKGAQITAIIECAGVWFAGSKFGLTWRAKQIAIHKMPEKIGDFAFKGLGSAPTPSKVTTALDEEDEEMGNQMDDDEAFSAPAHAKSVVAAMMPPAPAPAPEPVDDEEGDDIEPAPMPVKKTTTTVVKKKVIAKKA
jgi:hypothetical protein